VSPKLAVPCHAVARRVAEPLAKSECLGSGTRSWARGGSRGLFQRRAALDGLGERHEEIANPLKVLGRR